MGRRRGLVSYKQEKKIKQNKANKVYDNEYFTGGTVVPAANQITITDTKSSKHFGILLSTQQSVEEFQRKSGMMKAFTTEYQYHYWALVARVKVGGEILDIAIPTVMFNYRQEVSGAAVDFHLNDVEEASKKNEPIANIINDVIVNSTFGKFLAETFKDNVEWMSVPMNTCHVHPGQLSSFSGTDYAKTINDPGICFPLAEPHEQPSFSSIICHATHQEGYVGKIVRTEYRFATKEGNKINYLHGTCLSYWRGYTVKAPAVQSLFSNKAEYVKQGYITTDASFGGTIVLEGNQLLNSIISEFNKIEFSPHTEDILAERITKPAPVVYGNHYNKPYNGRGAYYNSPAEGGSLLTQIANASGEPTLIQKKELLIREGYAAGAVYSWDYKKVNDMYDKIMAINEELKAFTGDTTQPKASTKKDDDANEMGIEDKIKFLLANGIKSDEIRGKNTMQIDEIFEIVIAAIEADEDVVIEDIVDAKPTIDFKSNKKVVDFLNRYGLDDTTINALSNDEIATVLEELNF